jgi:hypothetical protein
MFDQLFENLQKATESTIQFQQEVLKSWTGQWPGLTKTPAPWGEQFQKFQKNWGETVTGLFKKQQETLEAQFQAGLEHLEEAFQMAASKDPEEFRKKTVELWQKTFESLRQFSEAQVRDFQAAMAKWAEMATKKAS